MVRGALNNAIMIFACPQPGQAGTKKIIIHAETRRRGGAEMFFIINFFTPRPLRLRVQKNILPRNGKISRVNY
jgi:hypothetical protein